jgi:hypothetical protein
MNGRMKYENQNPRKEDERGVGENRFDIHIAESA